MEPDCTLTFDAPPDAACFVRRASELTDLDGAPLFGLDRCGAVVSLHVHQHEAALRHRKARRGPSGPILALGDLGLRHLTTDAAPRGEHAPEGVWVIHGASRPDPRRVPVALTRYAPTMLSMFGLAPPDWMEPPLTLSASAGGAA